eukprot:Rmarinus@m.18972
MAKRPQQTKNQRKAKKVSHNERSKSSSRKNRKKCNEDVSLFNEKLSELGYYIHEVEGDGNCLFHALADQLGESGDAHRWLRKKACELMISHRIDFEPFVEDDESFDDYVARMEEDGTWGSQMELQACSIFLNADIIVYQLDSCDFVVSNSKKPSRTLRVAFFDECHYNSVRPMAHDVQCVFSECENDQEREVMLKTGCASIRTVREALDAFGDDVDGAIVYLNDTLGDRDRGKGKGVCSTSSRSRKEDVHHRSRKDDSGKPVKKTAKQRKAEDKAQRKATNTSHRRRSHSSDEEESLSRAVADMVWV